MYFSGKLTIDPAEITKINRIKPVKAFNRMLFHLTAGLVSDQEEQETFTAVSILQQLNHVFLTLGIDNIVRLSHDDMDFYIDVEGRKNDLKDAFDQYDLTIKEAMSQVFNKLFLVLEYEKNAFYYLIEVDIYRTHEVGEYPIEIKVNGLLKAFRTEVGLEAKQIKERMESIFQSQEKYETFLAVCTAEFEGFMHELQAAIKKFIKVDDVRVEVKKKMIAPKEKVSDVKTFSASRASLDGGGNEPVFDPVYNMDTLLFYSLIWSTLAYEHHIQIQNTDIYSDQGKLLGSVDDQAIDAANLKVLREDIT